MARKKRTAIPGRVATEVLYLSDKTCCVCHDPSKGVQIHHIDEDPSNHDPENLAVLCLNCHEKTQTHGGFSRSLSADLVRKYSGEWLKTVAQRRSAEREGVKPRRRPVAIRGSKITNSVVQRNVTVGDIGLIEADEVVDSEIKENLALREPPVPESHDVPLFAVEMGGGTNLESNFIPRLRIKPVGELRIANIWWRFRGPRFSMDWRQAVATQLDRTPITNAFDLSAIGVDDELVEADQMGLEIKFQWRDKMRHELHLWRLTRRVTSKIQWSIGDELPVLQWSEALT